MEMIARCGFWSKERKKGSLAFLTHFFKQFSEPVKVMWKKRNSHATFFSEKKPHENILPVRSKSKSRIDFVPRMNQRNAFLASSN